MGMVNFLLFNIGTHPTLFMMVIVVDMSFSNVISNVEGPGHKIYESCIEADSRRKSHVMWSLCTIVSCSIIYEDNCYVIELRKEQLNYV